MALVASVRDVEGKSDSASGVTLIGASCCAKASRAHAGVVLTQYLKCHLVRGLYTP